MLGRNLKLPRNVICYKTAEKSVVLIVKEIVKADTRADKHLFNSLYLLYLFEHIHILGVVHLEIFAGGGSKTFARGADSALLLLIARGVTEVCGRTSDVIYVSLEIGKP